MSKLAKAFVASAAILLVLVIGAMFLYFVPKTYVSIDVNPSIELNLNLLGRVVDAQGLNEDGQKVISQLDLNNKTYDQALTLLVAQMERDGYLNDEGESIIVLSIHSSADNTVRQIYDTSKSILDDADVEIEVSVVDKEKIDKAHTLGISAGQLALLEEYADRSGYSLYEFMELLLSEMHQPIEDDNDENLFEVIIDAVSAASLEVDDDADTVSGASQNADDVDTVSGASQNAGDVDTVSSASPYYDDDDDDDYEDDEYEDDEYEDDEYEDDEYEDDEDEDDEYEDDDDDEYDDD